MKNILLGLILLIYSPCISSDNDDSQLPNTMFSYEGGYQLNTLNGKSGIELRSYYWFKLKNSIGAEVHVYAPNSERNYLDYQIGINFRRIAVDFHPLTFDVLVGPSLRSTRDEFNEKREFVGALPNNERYWRFDGVNLGFGVGYRWQNNSIYCMPRINHLDSYIQISMGYKYHFDVSLTGEKHKSRYKLRKTHRSN